MLSRLLSFFKKKPKTKSLANGNSDKISQLEEIVGLQINDPDLFLRALRHKSTVSEARYSKNDSYERLEFLGDAVLDLVVTEIIFQLYPTKDEGFLTKLRAKIVKGESLAEYSKSLGLNHILEFGERSRTNGIQYSKGILADVFEAVVGAIYLDHGYEAVSLFIKKVVFEYVQFDEVIHSLDNNKSLLLELTQAHKMDTPVYKVVSEYGPGHDKTFKIQVLIEGRPYGMAEGKSKKQAEQKAAKYALDRLNDELPAN